MKIIEVHWTDSESYLGWKAPDIIKELGTANVISVGHEVVSDKDRIILAIAYDKKNDSFCQIMIIPRGCITKIRILKRSI